MARTMKMFHVNISVSVEAPNPKDAASIAIQSLFETHGEHLHEIAVKDDTGHTTVIDIEDLYDE